MMPDADLGALTLPPSGLRKMPLPLMLPQSSLQCDFILLGPQLGLSTCMIRKSFVIPGI